MDKNVFMNKLSNCISVGNDKKYILNTKSKTNFDNLYKRGCDEIMQQFLQVDSDLIKRSQSTIKSFYSETIVPSDSFQTQESEELSFEKISSQKNSN